MGLKPLHDWVLIKRDEPKEKTSGGIIIPESAKDKPSQGTVVAVGPGRFKKEPGKKETKEKKFVPTVLKPGQRVMFIDYMAKDIDIGAEKVTLIREEEVLGTVEGEGGLALKPDYHVEAKEDRPPMVQDRPKKESGDKPVGKAKVAAEAAPKKAASKKTAESKKKVATPRSASGKPTSRKAEAGKTASKTAATKKTAVKKAVPKKMKKGRSR